MSKLAVVLAVVAFEIPFAVARVDEPSSLVVEVATDHGVYRAGRAVRITLTEMNTSAQAVDVAIGCQILQGYATSKDGSLVWVFRDLRLCLTGQAPLAAGASRSFEMFWNTRRSRLGRLGKIVRVPPGEYTITVGVDGVSDSTTVRLRGRR